LTHCRPWGNSGAYASLSAGSLTGRAVYRIASRIFGETYSSTVGT